MAGFNLTAKLNLTGPYNVKPVVQSIQSQLSNIKANISIGVNSSTASGVKNITGLVNLLDSTLRNTATSADKLKDSLAGVSNAFNTNSSAIKASANSISTIAANAKKSSGSVRALSTDMEKFGKEAGLAVKRAGAFAVATGAIFGLVRAMNSGISKAIDFEKGVIKLVQVTKISKAGLKGLTDEIDRLSVGLGTSSSELLEVAKIFTQAGLSINDTKIAMDAVAKSTLAPSFDNVINTTEGLIAVVGQFKDELTGVGIGAKDFEKVLGSINRVSADFAVEADDIVSAIRRTGGVFAAASRGIGQPIDQLNELIAVFTSVRATTRESADSIATGLRTIFTRLQRPKTIELLRELGVELQDVEGKFIGPYQALQKLGEAFNNVDTRSPLFASITEELGGIRQIGKLIPAIKQYTEAQKVLGVAQQGQSSLAEDATIAQQSLSNQITKTREEFLKLIRDITGTNSFQFLAKGALELASGFIKVADSVKELIPLLTVAFAARSLGGAHEFFKGFTGSFGRGPLARKNLGGQIQGFATGGLVPGYGDHDSVPANLTPGEFVLRKKAVEHIGVDNLQKLNKGGGVVNSNRNFYGKDIDPELLEAFGGDEDTIKKTIKNRQLSKALKDKLSPNEQSNLTLLNRFYNKDQGKHSNLSLVLGSKDTPTFGGVFLRPSPGVDYNAVRKQKLGTIAKNSGDLLSLTQKFPGTDVNTDVYSKFSLGFIEESTSKKMESSLENELQKSVYGLVKRYGAGFNLPEKSAGDQIIKQTGLETATGVMFESMVNVLTNNLKTGASSVFDIVGNKTGISNLFGNVPSQYTDVKRTFSNDIITGSGDSTLFKKAFRTALNNPSLISINQGSLPQDYSHVTSGSKLNKRKRLASGGSVTDTVPALLTPGEFVVNKQAAERIGYGRLNHLNNADKNPRGYAKGGVVQHFAAGGGVPVGSISPPARSAYDDVMNAHIKEINKANQAIIKHKAVVDALNKLGLDSIDATEEMIGAENKLKVLYGQNADVQKRATEASNKVTRSIIRNDERNNNPRASGFGNNRGFLQQSSDALGNIRGFGPRFSRSSIEQQEKIRDRRNSELNRVQSLGYGLIGSSITAASFLPEAKSSSGAGAKQGFISGAGAAGAGIELGSLLGPQGAAIGGVIGGLIGTLDGINRGFYEFEKNASLKRLDLAIKASSELFEKIANGTATQEDKNKYQSSVATEKINAINIDANTQSSNRFSIGNAISETSLFAAWEGLQLGNVAKGVFDKNPFGVKSSDLTLGGIGRAINPFSHLSAADQFKESQRQEFLGQDEKEREILRQQKPQLITSFLKDEGRTKLTATELSDLGKSSTRAAQRFEEESKKIEGPKEQTKESKDEHRQKLQALRTKIEEEERKIEGDLLEKQKANIIEYKNMVNSMSKNRVQLDLLSDSISQADSVLNQFGKKMADSNSSIDALINRSTGGTQFHSKSLANPFQDLRISSTKEVGDSLNFIKSVSGLSERDNSGFGKVANNILEGQQLLQTIKQTISDNIGNDPTKLGESIDRIKSEVGKVISDETTRNNITTKLEALARDTGTGIKPAEEINNTFKNLLDDLTPIIKDQAELASKTIELIETGIKNFQDRQFNIINQQSINKQQVVEIGVESKLRNISQQEETTGKINVQGRNFQQNRLVSGLTGGLGSNVDAIVNRIEELDKTISESTGITTKDQEELAKNRLESVNLRKGLDILSKNTIKLAAAELKLSDIQSKSQALGSITKSFLGGSFEDKISLNKGFSLLAQFKGADETNRQRAFGALTTNPQAFNQLDQAKEAIRGLGLAGKKVAEELDRDLLERTFGKGFLDKIGAGPEAEKRAKADVEAARKEAEQTQIKNIELGNHSLIEALEANKNVFTKELPNSIKESFSRIEPLTENTIALRKLTTALTTGGVEKGFQLPKLEEKAGGGPIRGPGTGTSDSIPARLSHGEYVLRAAAVNKIGIPTLNHMNGTGEIPGFADGGPMTREELRIANKKRYEEKLAGLKSNSKYLAQKQLGQENAIRSGELLENKLGNKRETPQEASLRRVPQEERDRRKAINKERAEKESVYHQRGLEKERGRIFKEYNIPTDAGTGYLNRLRTEIGLESPGKERDNQRNRLAELIESGKPKPTNTTFEYGIDARTPNEILLEATNNPYNNPYNNDLSIIRKNIQYNESKYKKLGYKLPKNFESIGIGRNQSQKTIEAEFDVKYKNLFLNRYKKADGGSITGVGGPSSDSINALVSNGEYIVSANAANKIGVGNLNYMNRNGTIPKFADGGSIGNAVSGIFGAKTQNLPQIDISGLQQVFNGFKASSEKLAQSIDSLKTTKITMTATHTVNVNLTGSEALAAMQGNIIKLVLSEVNKNMPKSDLVQRIETNSGNYA